ncbi:hypothetical protein H9L19_06875 [Weissella diestrammenae]|uniref:DNA-directed RNA polymerase beta subunit n=1 Tax=Weissella diestrammenae TaxID=1162633 RepID=A0A7G9T4R6_9LACO|nr:hypothetical protein [Weissella diestrammenae]MCM0582802.1 hypothetical protein [Weissella diestrammenae]QNN75091.1 hypothetical protein H9L19_06875 [Weissella diestrammenae]
MNQETINQETLIRAKRFFENDYKERGMVKWQGYYLSDHTEDAEKNRLARKQAYEQGWMPEMSMVEIGEVLFDAYSKGRMVAIQERVRQDEFVPQLIHGVVKGYGETDIFVGNHQIEMNNIRWAIIK